jgi:ribosomal protein S1
VAVTPAGAFVEFDATPVEGLVPAEDFPSQARRARRRRRARERELLITPDLGMAVIVRIARVDHRARRILLGLVTSGPRSRERDLDRLNDSGLDQAGGARTGDRRKSRKHLQYREPAPHRRGGGRTSHRRRGSGR